MIRKGRKRMNRNYRRLKVSYNLYNINIISSFWRYTPVKKHISTEIAQNNQDYINHDPDLTKVIISPGET